MKKSIKFLLFFCLVSFSFTKKNDAIPKSNIKGKCGSVFQISTGGFSDSWVIAKVKFTNTVNPSNDWASREISSVSYLGSGDVNFEFGSGTYDVRVQLYEDNDPATSGYLVLKDALGTIISCQPIVFGTHYYYFSGIGSCNWYILSISPAC